MCVYQNHCYFKYMDLALGIKPEKTLMLLPFWSRVVIWGKPTVKMNEFFSRELYPPRVSGWALLRVLDSPFFQMMASLTFHDTSNKIMCQGNWKAHSLGWQVEWAAWIFMRTNWPFLSWMLIRNKWNQSYPQCISTSFKADSLLQNAISKGKEINVSFLFCI